MATAGFASQLDSGIGNLKRQSTREFASGIAPGQVLIRRNSNTFANSQSANAKSRWQTLRVAFRLSRSAKKSAKVAPSVYVPHPKDFKTKPGCAVQIQKVARGYIVRKELSYWDDTYFDDIYGWDDDDDAYGY